MNNHQDCPDLRYYIEWGTARSYEGFLDVPDHAGHDPEACEASSLFYYTLFYAKFAGDL